MNYYNDNDPFAAKWLRCLIRDGLIPDGDVDERPIQDVEAQDLKGYTQCHFFAGIGGWSRALQIAGWPTDEPVWTGSCPCQPLSVAGKQQGEKDERHLWPEFYRLISQCRPIRIFGEQSESPDGIEWLDGVSLDLEEIGYAVGSVDLPSASVGAPNKRQRAWWVADASGGGRQLLQKIIGEYGEVEKTKEQIPNACSNGNRNGWVADSAGPRCIGQVKQSKGKTRDEARMRVPCSSLKNSRMGNPNGNGCGKARECIGPTGNDGTHGNGSQFWGQYRIIGGRDGKSRRIPIEPAIFPLAPRVPGRVGLLRGAGNAINPFVAAKFIKAYMEITK